MLLPSIAIFPVYWLAMVFLGGGQEEIGWRGYIMPFLEKRFGVFYGTVILGLVWAIWHLPLWFIPGSNQTYMNFCVFVMLTTGYSFIFSWGLKKAGNRPMSGLVMHGTANAFVPVFPVMVLNHNVSQPRYWIWVSLMLICGITLYLFSNHNNDSE
ncbi:MAG TPA: CPBP family intramembrane metalloprotease [Spirochaetota bacterium]|nr:CPBP family intramembrane metalloprotease [Spirochaetota bacterium]